MLLRFLFFSWINNVQQTDNFLIADIIANQRRIHHQSTIVQYSLFY